MILWYLEALAAIAVALSVLMSGAWLVQQRTGNSGWVDAAPALVLPRHIRAVRLRQWQRMGRQSLPDAGGEFSLSPLAGRGLG
jgi:hypothetical protein